ncbi:EAL domain-containing protein [Arsenicitalea aurantiaca]|uniref:EAL domain-containing protein n=1 Tax=Arsenicitalea aurantiaca TaxID=1783274 RepID=A0A433XBE8_9HYPH|nr:EAL domain-containing response regulator [Arsenicitalea aurantiaca]RUT31350.1 EAL domain-containing protein [Arsenicitalea aurantiaca]
MPNTAELVMTEGRMEAGAEIDPRRVAVIEDNPLVRETIVQMVRRLDREVRGFDPAGDMLQPLEQYRAGLIILDLSLGRLDAVQVLNHLAERDYSGRILLISGIDHDTLRDVQMIGARRGLRMLTPLRKPLRTPDLATALAGEGEEAPQVSVLDIAPPAPLDVEIALANNWLELWYQPKCEVSTGRVLGAEALIRLRHPAMGIMPPVSFVPPSGTNAYEKMTQFVIEQAARQHAKLPLFASRIKFSINASIALMQKPVFVDMIRDAWPDPFGHPGLIVEVTEDEVTGDMVLAREVATQLKLHNVELSIDDFGAGYSSFSRFRDLPFAELKLDRSFVMGCGSDPRKQAVCRAASAMARSFHVRTVAEGVETEAELAVIADAEFDAAQGYFFARPMPFEGFRTALVARFNRVEDGLDMNRSA